MCAWLPVEVEKLPPSAEHCALALPTGAQSAEQLVTERCFDTALSLLRYLPSRVALSSASRVHVVTFRGRETATVGCCALRTGSADWFWPVITHATCCHSHTSLSVSVSAAVLAVWTVVESAIVD